VSELPGVLIYEQVLGPHPKLLSQYFWGGAWHVLFYPSSCVDFDAQPNIRTIVSEHNVSSKQLLNKKLASNLGWGGRAGPLSLSPPLERTPEISCSVAWEGGGLENPLGCVPTPI
jgi:hypothetical protein